MGALSRISERQLMAGTAGSLPCLEADGRSKAELNYCYLRSPPAQADPLSTAAAAFPWRGTVTRLLPRADIGRLGAGAHQASVDAPSRLQR